jgi:L-aminopeptidase/D-esterase-like protein
MADGFLIGHYTNTEQITGCTVIICPERNTASCYVGGASPGTRELVLLQPEKKMQSITALLLTGGSAYGLAAATGVMRFLAEQGRGYRTGGGSLVPIVPAAVIFDLGLGGGLFFPDEEAGYRAAQGAAADFSLQGSVGAGTGATVGKWNGFSACMKGGLGTARSQYREVNLRAVAVVNAVGDVFDDRGRVIAGARDERTKFACLNPELDMVRVWERRETAREQHTHTVLSVLMTNAGLSKLEAYRLAHNMQVRLSRVFYPYSTQYDGDVCFVLSSGAEQIDFEILAELGGRTLHQAIISAVRSASSLGGIPCCTQIGSG